VRILLDTHVFLWWISRDHQLSSDASELMADIENELFLSPASVWEIVIKAQAGRLPLPTPIARFITEEMTENAIDALPIAISHALAVAELPPLHKDPFDRMIIAQAQCEKLPILTADPMIRQYDVETMW
jgi:PIN domain nuclease of toxin-antitoxin system